MASIGLDDSGSNRRFDAAPLLEAGGPLFSAPVDSTAHSPTYGQRIQEDDFDSNDATTFDLNSMMRRREPTASDNRVDCLRTVMIPIRGARLSNFKRSRWERFHE